MFVTHPCGIRHVPLLYARNYLPRCCMNVQNGWKADTSEPARLVSFCKLGMLMADRIDGAIDFSQHRDRALVLRP